MLGFDISTRSVRVAEDFVAHVGFEMTRDRWKTFIMELSMIGLKLCQH